MYIVCAHLLQSATGPKDHCVAEDRLVAAEDKSEGTLFGDLPWEIKWPGYHWRWVSKYEELHHLISRGTHKCHGRSKVLWPRGRNDVTRRQRRVILEADNVNGICRF